MARCSGSSALSVDWIIGLLSSRLRARTQSRKLAGDRMARRKAGRAATQDGGAVLPALALDHRRRLAALCRLVHLQPLGPDPGLRAWRYRRQYADERRSAPCSAGRAGTTFASIGSTRHGGANIHWSRLVDLPLAGLILLVKPLVGGADAERIAVAVAPLLPLLAADVQPRADDEAAGRRAGLAARRSSACSAPIRPSACSRRLRIDHHGWQLAFLGARRVGGGRSQARARRRGAGDRNRPVAVDRAGDDDLSGAAGRRDGADVGRRPRPAPPAGGLCSIAGGDDRRGLPDIRVRRQPAWRCATPCRRSGCPMRRSAGR